MDARLQRNLAAAVQLPRPLRTGPIGLDFGTERVNLVQFSGGAKPRVQAAASVAYPVARQAVLESGSALAQAIEPVLRRGGFRGRRVVAALPPGRVTLRFVPYRRTPGQDDGTAIVTALREQQADIADAVLDYLPIRPKSEEQSERAALVAYAPRAEVVALLDVLRAAQLDVRALEVGPVAIKRLLAAVHDQRDGNKIMSINFGGPASFVTVLWDRDLLLDRSIEFGMDVVLGTIEDALEVSAEEAARLLRRYGIGLDPDLPAAGREFAHALLEILKPAFIRLAEQVKKVLVYTAAETRGGAIDRIYLLGSVARCAGVDRLLQAMVEVPVETINPFYGFDVAGGDWQRLAREPLPGIAVSAGLALRGIVAHG
ncbi:MAG: pilus assembly protein PilM [Gammaproteobacteria bacterium]|nr:pilus assembly protein PilM [Gammaproteobacteria bacterium]MCP5202515.1 pilus assembly protein PilM [Gammaproteobacteria bacterium]